MGHQYYRRMLAAALTLWAVSASGQTPTLEKLPDAAAVREQVVADQVVAVLGLGVRAESGAEVGRLVDVLVNAAGEPRAAIVDVGGFLGVGNRKVAVEWRSLRFAIGEPPFAMLPVPPDQIKSATAYDPAKPVELVAPPSPPPSPPAPRP